LIIRMQMVVVQLGVACGLPYTAPCFSCWYTNTDSLINKLVELKFLAENSKIKPLIIAVTEVKPKNSRFSPQLSEYQLNGYDHFHVNFEKM